MQRASTSISVLACITLGRLYWCHSRLFAAIVADCRPHFLDSWFLCRKRSRLRHSLPSAKRLIGQARLWVIVELPSLDGLQYVWVSLHSLHLMARFRAFSIQFGWNIGTCLTVTNNVCVRHWRTSQVWLWWCRNSHLRSLWPFPFALNWP